MKKNTVKIFCGDEIKLAKGKKFLKIFQTKGIEVSENKDNKKEVQQNITFLHPSTKTTIQAFKEILNTKGIYKELGMNENTFNSLKKRHKDGVHISLDKMEEILQKAGYKVVQEKLWSSD